MLAKYWQAALVAAILPLTVSTVGAQNPAKNYAATDYRVLSSTDYASCPAALSACGDCCAKEKCCAEKDCCDSGKCVKDGACCEKCANGSCCKANKCECGKGKDCCCGDKCECNKTKTTTKAKGCCQGQCCGCCAMSGKLAKAQTIIVVVPSPMPMPPGLYADMPCPLPPPVPPGPAVMLPHPLPPPPPMLTPPGLPVPTLTPPVMPPQTVAMPAPPAACYACPTGGSACPVMAAVNSGLNLDTCLSVLGVISDLCCSHAQAPSLPSICAEAVSMAVDLCGDLCPAKAPQPAPCYLQHPPQYMPPAPPFPGPEMPRTATLPAPTPEGSACAAAVVPCTIAAPAKTEPARKVRIVAKPYSNEIEMSMDDGTCLSCKKMTVNLHDSTYALSRVSGRIRVRSEEMKATADCVRTVSKDRLVLEGDAVLRYHKDGQPASVIRGDHIELNLATGSVTVRGVSKATTEEVSDGTYDGY